MPLSPYVLTTKDNEELKEAFRKQGYALAPVTPCIVTGNEHSMFLNCFHVRYIDEGNAPRMETVVSTDNGWWTFDGVNTHERVA